MGKENDQRWRDIPKIDITRASSEESEKLKEVAANQVVKNLENATTRSIKR